MLTGCNFEMAYGFTVVNIVADIILKFTNQVLGEHFIDFIFKVNSEESCLLD